MDGRERNLDRLVQCISRTDALLSSREETRGVDSTYRIRRDRFVVLLPHYGVESRIRSSGNRYWCIEDGALFVCSGASVDYRPVHERPRQ